MKKFFLMCMMMLIASMCYAQHVVEAGPFDNVYANVSVGGVVPTNDVELENVRPQFSLEIGKDVPNEVTGEEVEKELRLLIENKNYLGIEVLLKDADIDEKYVKASLERLSIY